LTVTGPGVRIPLSPRAEKQIKLKPFKSYDLEGFLLLATPTNYPIIIVYRMWQI
jgi:hypothetical protein